jgi:hypothetical protein
MWAILNPVTSSLRDDVTLNICELLLSGWTQIAQIWRAYRRGQSYVAKANRHLELQDKPHNLSIIPLRLGENRFRPIGIGFHPVVTGLCRTYGVYPATLSVIELKGQFDTELHFTSLSTQRWCAQKSANPSLDLLIFRISSSHRISPFDGRWDGNYLMREKYCHMT